MDPRGGKGLVARVQEEARVPVLAHLDGINHVYVHASADPAMAEAVVLDAKLRRTAICGAMETLLVDRAFAAPDRLTAALRDAGCEVRGDAAIRAIDPAAADADVLAGYHRVVIAEIGLRGYAGLRSLLGAGAPPVPDEHAPAGFTKTEARTVPGLYSLALTRFDRENR